MCEIIFHILMNSIAGARIIPKRVRNFIYKIGGVKSKSITFGDHCYFSGACVSVGKGVYINRAVYFDAAEKIQIEDNVFIGMNVHFITSSHEFGSSEKRAGENKKIPITIEEGCWIGADSVLLPGSVVGHGTIVSGGSVVHGILSPNCIYAGNPIKLIKKLEG